jgi:hypothetical protein
MGRPWKIDKNLVGKTKLCECGCGEEILILSKSNNEYRRFKRGHHLKGPNNLRWKGKFTNTQGYVLVHAQNHPHHDSDGNVREHILIIEKHLGRYLVDGEIVHHINHVKWDNRIENLQLMTEHDHIVLHSTKDMSDRFCYKCGSKDPHTAWLRNRKWFSHPISGKKWLCKNCYDNIRYHWKMNNKIIA